jgi:putative ABC transport system substrate-binding protein
MMIAISRRNLMAALAGSAVAWSATARAQQPGKIYRIGFLANDPTIPTTAAGQAFLDGLQEGGFIEGRNITIERRFAKGSVSVARQLADQLTHLDLDLIVTSGELNHLAIKRVTSTIPVVMVNATDPVGDGIVASLARPGGNITGLVQVPSAELVGKRVQLFKDAVPHISRLLVLTSPDYTTDQLAWPELEKAAQSLAIVLIPVHVREGSEIADALSGAMRERPDALFGLAGSLSLTFRSVLNNFAMINRLPSMYGFADIVRDGGLIAYGTNRPDLFRRAALYAAKVLKGANPADLPIEQPIKFDLVINLKTAAVLGLTIPRDVLLLADEVIE